MVRAILEGRKTQTRRICKVQPPADALWGSNGVEWMWLDDRDDTADRGTLCPFGVVGDRLYVRETFAAKVPGCREGLSYRADHVDPRGDGPAHPMTWTPSIHMPRWASRITLEVTGVRVERLNAISAADAIAEGIAPISCSALWWNYLDKGRALTRPESSFRSLWESINGVGSWDANPWTWVVEFKAVKP